MAPLCPIDEAPPPGDRVLLVDGDAQYLQAVARAHTLAGYVVETASGAAEASSAIAWNRFDILVGDIGSLGSDGGTFLGIVRELSPDLPIVAMTRGRPDGVPTDAVEFPLLKFMSKPQDVEDVVRFVLVALLCSRWRLPLGER